MIEPAKDLGEGEAEGGEVFRDLGFRVEEFAVREEAGGEVGDGSEGGPDDERDSSSEDAIDDYRGSVSGR